MLDKTKTPRRGAFDYLLDGNSVHVDPPPPIHRGPPQRIVINIDLTDRRNLTVRDKRGSRLASWILVFIVGFILLALTAHGQTRWQDNRVGQSTYWYSPDTGMRGQERQMPDGSMRSTWQDPSGHVTDCVVQRFGNSTTRRCQ